MATSTQVRAWWAEYRCNPDKMVPFRLFNRNVGRVPTLAIPAFQALERALLGTGYRPESAWVYNCRPIAGSTSWSLHSYGIAIDIDPALNPYTTGDPFAGGFKPNHIAAVEAIKTTTGEQVWTWGGRWTRPDRMHFQLNVKPDYRLPDPQPIEGDEDMETLIEGDTGWGVNRLQTALNGWIELHSGDKTPLEVDGEFGPATTERVTQFQNGSKLPARYPRGDVGGITWGWLMEYVADKVDTENPYVLVPFTAQIVPQLPDEE